MGVSKERSRCVILFDILKAVREGKKSAKTRIMQRACLDWRCFNRYFEFLLERGFVAKCNPDEGMYEITEKGRGLLKLLKEIVSLCEG